MKLGPRKKIKSNGSNGASNGHSNGYTAEHEEEVGAEALADAPVEEEQTLVEVPKKKRGRPRKEKQDETPVIRFTDSPTPTRRSTPWPRSPPT